MCIYRCITQRSQMRVSSTIWRRPIVIACKVELYNTLDVFFGLSSFVDRCRLFDSITDLLQFLYLLNSSHTSVNVSSVYRCAFGYWSLVDTSPIFCPVIWCVFKNSNTNMECSPVYSKKYISSSVISDNMLFTIGNISIFDDGNISGNLSTSCGT